MRNYFNIFAPNTHCARVVAQRIVTGIEKLSSQNHREKNFSVLLLNNNTLAIIKKTNKKNCCYFSIEKRSGNIIYCNKTVKIVFFTSHLFFDNFDATAL